MKLTNASPKPCSRRRPKYTFRSLCTNLRLEASYSHPIAIHCSPHSLKFVDGSFPAGQPKIKLRKSPRQTMASLPPLASPKPSY